MTLAEWETLIVGGVLGAALTLLVQWVLQRTGHRQGMELERFKQLLQEEGTERDALRARVTPLLTTAGYLSTHLGGWNANHHAEEIGAHLRELETFPAQFAEYPELQHAIRAFYSTAGWRAGELGVLLTDEQRRVRQHQDVMDSQRGTPEEQEQQWQEKRAESEHVRTVELPERYQTLVAVAKALLEVTPSETPGRQGFIAWIRSVGRLGKRETGELVAVPKSEQPEPDAPKG